LATARPTSSASSTGSPNSSRPSGVLKRIRRRHGWR
jgi:hypothetical protein